MKVLVNYLGQHSLWSDNVDIPTGWHEVYKSSEEKSCKDYIEKNWKNIIPNIYINQ